MNRLSTTCRYGTLLAVLFVSFVLVPIPKATASCPPGAVCWTGSAGDGNWETAANWTGGTVPVDRDDVSISLPFSEPSVVTISSAPTVRSLTIGGGVTLSCTDTCRVTVSAGGAQITNSGTISNSGTITVEGGGASITNDAGSVITNNSGGSIIVTGGSASITNAGTISNSGTITVEGGGATIANSGTITNSGGSITVEGGGASITNSGEIFNCVMGKITGEIAGNAVNDGCPSIQTATTTIQTATTTAPPQGITYVTSISTVATQATYTRTSSSAVATSFVTSTVSYTWYDDTFTLSGSGPRTCYYRPIELSAVAGDKIYGSLTSSKIVNFYVMSDKQFSSKWYCDQLSALLRAERVTKYSLAWTVPSDGTYYFVILSELNQNETANVTFTSWTESAQFVAITSFATSIHTSVETFTQTLTTVRTQTLAPSGQIPLLPLAIVGIVLVVAVVLGYMKVTRKK